MANIVSQIADKVRPIGVSTNYGEPVEVGDQTLIPVSLGWFGFGGGGDGEDNGGGGGGGVSIPVGAYVRRPGSDLQFEPNLISLLAVSIPTIWVTGKALSKVIRALKK
uniref:Sporulation protein YtfJ n=1 Tax=Neobacillus citreus TaxID=2833578 RepID=A0A942SZX1_9BACI